MLGTLLHRMGRLCLCLGAIAVAMPVCAGAEQDPLIGRQIDDFKLKDYRGEPHALGDFKDKKLVVVAFLGTECPLAKLYGPRMQQLAEEFGPQGVAFLGINSNRQDSITEMAAYARIHGIEFPILKDLSNVVADQFGATRTPEVFVLDEDRVVRYHGRIDGQYGFGYRRRLRQAEARPARSWPRPSTSCWPARKSACRSPKSRAA